MSCRWFGPTATAELLAFYNNNNNNGRAVDLLFGTSQSSVPWQTVMLSRLPEKLDQ